MNTSRKVVSLAILSALGFVGTVNAEGEGPKWSNAKQVFNSYEHNSALLPVAGHLSNWGVYGRGGLISMTSKVNTIS